MNVYIGRHTTQRVYGITSIYVHSPKIDKSNNFKIFRRKLTKGYKQDSNNRLDTYKQKWGGGGDISFNKLQYQ